LLLLVERSLAEESALNAFLGLDLLLFGFGRLATPSVAMMPVKEFAN